VLTTGTGSGKSLSYIVPIVDRILRQGGGDGIKAIVIYPMNALANSQAGELGQQAEAEIQGLGLDDMSTSRRFAAGSAGSLPSRRRASRSRSWLTGCSR
jgi:ATP-dependent helicase YprA (DUF1998 family)